MDTVEERDCVVDTIKKLNEEQIRLVIANFIGLFRIAPLKRTTNARKDSATGKRLWYCFEDMGGAKTYDEIPNYPRDLNAIEKAENTFLRGSGSWFVWSKALRAVTNDSLPLRATARQRSEALVYAYVLELTDKANGPVKAEEIAATLQKKHGT